MSALKTNDPMIALKRDQDLRYYEPTCVFIRVHDNQLIDVPKAGDFSDLDTTMLPGEKIQAYNFNL